MEQILSANTSERHREDARLLVIHPQQQHGHTTIEYLRSSDFVDQFQTGDVLVVNAASTLPASFRGVHRESGDPIELRLARHLGADPTDFPGGTAFSSVPVIGGFPPKHVRLYRKSNRVTGFVLKRD